MHACTVWQSYCSRCKKLAAKVCTKQRDWSYEELLHTLKLPILQTRCKVMKPFKCKQHGLLSESPFVQRQPTGASDHIGPAVVYITLVGILANTFLPFFPNQYVCGMNCLPSVL